MKDLNGRTRDGFLAEIARKFNVEKTTEQTPSKVSEICMYLDHQWYKLTPNFDTSTLAS